MFCDKLTKGEYKVEEKLLALTKEQSSHIVTLVEVYTELIEKVLALTEAQAEYVLRRLQCLLQDES